MMSILSNKLTPIIISLVVLTGAVIWFASNYADHPIKIAFNPNKVATYEIQVDEKVNLNQPFKAIVHLHTGNVTVNAIGLNLKYESQKLRVVSIDTTQSFCQFYPEKKFNDNLGEVKLSCGSPNPGFSGDNPIIIIEFMPVKIGTTSLIIGPQSQILKSDGKGTNVLSDYPQKAINIINSL